MGVAARSLGVGVSRLDMVTASSVVGESVMAGIATRAGVCVLAAAMRIGNMRPVGSAAMATVVMVLGSGVSSMSVSFNLGMGRVVSLSELIGAGRVLNCMIGRLANLMSLSVSLTFTTGISTPITVGDMALISLTLSYSSVVRLMMGLNASTILVMAGPRSLCLVTSR